MADSGCSVLSPSNSHKSIVDIKLHIDKILRFLDCFGWLADVYVSDFFVCDYWKKLPLSWQSCFSQMDAPDIAEILSYKTESHSRLVLPLSLLAYRETIKSLSLKRTMVRDEELKNVLPSLLSGKSRSELVSMSYAASNTTQIETIQFRGGQYVSLDAHYRKHVKPKKQHEIDQMSKVIGNLCQVIDCQRIIDIGAGLGHLSRLLNFKYGLSITTVEASGGHAPKAKKYDLDLKNEIKKKKKKMESLQSENLKSKESPGSIPSVDLPPSDFQNIINDTTSLPQSENLKSKESPGSIPSVDLPPSDFQNIINDTTSPLETTTTTTTNDIANPATAPCGEITTANPDDALSLPCHIVYEVSNTISPSEFLQTLMEKNSKTFSDKISNQKLEATLPSSLTECCPKTCSPPSSEKEESSRHTMVVCGLHACGDLTPTILRMFSQSPHISAVASVGCCYMKLTGLSNNEINETPECVGYPMSQYLLSKKHILSYEAKEMACHFVDAYRKRLIENCPSLQRHWYRAALQVVLKAVHPNFRHGCVKLSIKNVENLSFETYLEKALKYLGLNIDDVPSDIIKQCEATHNCWKEVVCFYTTRLSLAPVIEALLLLDRVLNLNELGFDCALVPIFEPLLSPRNFLLLATKPPPIS